MDFDQNQSTIAIIAPMSLPGGYEFDATINDKTIKVIVPPGGVDEGAVLQVPINNNSYEDNRDIENVKVLARIADGGKKKSKKNRKDPQKKSLLEDEMNITPEGVWRNSFFSCCEVINKPTFWVAFIFPWVIIGQLMQRLKLNVWGCRAENHQHTCVAIFLFGVSTVFVEGILMLLFFFSEDVIYSNIASAVRFYAAISFLYWTFMLRNTLRDGFGLPTTFIQNYHCDDFCTSLCCCQGCSLIQISRHTHNENDHKYEIVSKTGLPNNAPEIYYF